MLRAVRAVGCVRPRVTSTESVARRLTRVVGADGDAPGATASHPPKASNSHRRSLPTVASSRMNRGWTAERAPPFSKSYRAPTLLARASADWDGETLGVLRRRANALETRVKDALDVVDVERLAATVDPKWPPTRPSSLTGHGSAGSDWIGELRSGEPARACKYQPDRSVANPNGPRQDARSEVW